jgi:hypothetical protein
MASDMARERTFSSISQADLLSSRERAFSLSRERGFSWDAGFEDLDNPDLKDNGYTIQDIMQSIGRKRTMSGDVNFNFIPMPAESYQPYPAPSHSSSSGGGGNLSAGPGEGLSGDPMTGCGGHEMAQGYIGQETNNMTPQAASKGNIEPNFMQMNSGMSSNMMPQGTHPDVLRVNHMAMQHSMYMGMGMDQHTMQQHQLHGMPMQLLRPLMPNMGLGLIPMDDVNIRVGAYTKEERQIRIAKFRAKKNRRVWKKQIKYDCRKKLADNRPRIKGRFVTRKGDGEDDGEGEEHDHEAEGAGEVGGEGEHTHAHMDMSHSDSMAGRSDSMMEEHELTRVPIPDVDEIVLDTLDTLGPLLKEEEEVFP